MQKLRRKSREEKRELGEEMVYTVLVVLSPSNNNHRFQ
jgi:hypothetical protein